MDIHINVDGVHTAGENLSALARSANAKAGQALDSSNAAAKAHLGWQSSVAAQICQSAWTQHLHDLIDQVASTAQRLHDSANTHQQTDEEAARRLNEVLSDLAH